MAGPGDEIAAGAGGRGQLQASRADREQVIRTLETAFVQGMLAKDEFDQRVSQTFAARTYADLAVLAADLLGGQGPCAGLHAVSHSCVPSVVRTLPVTRPPRWPPSVP